MKIVFFGNADFGSETLNSLVSLNAHEVVAVVTNKDKSVGRNKMKVSTPIKKVAVENNIPVFAVDDIRDNNFIDKLRALNADIFIVIAYKILPKKIYSMPKHGAVNLHASLLPEYRGASPIQRCLIDNKRKTGLSSFYINKTIDGGSLIFQKEIKVFPDDNFYDLWKRLSDEGPSFMKETLRLIEKNQTKLINAKLVESYAPKISKEELLIDWMDSAEEIFHKIRAFSPYPCMYTVYDEKRVKIVSSGLFKKEHPVCEPGKITVLENKLLVACRDSFIEILKLKPESKGVLSGEDFINGFLNKKQNKIKNFN